MTWKMLQGGGVFTLAINVCTFLYAGLFVQRAKIANINHLLDVTPTPNWVVWFSKLLALLKMQLIMLFVVMLSGILFQMYSGFYQFEIGQYLYQLFVLDFISYAIWALMALFIQVLIGNAYLGLFVLLVLWIGIPILSAAGIEQDIYKYNQGPGYAYSDMNGYGTSFWPYIIYKLYWLLAGLLLLVFSALLWVRGLPHSFKERLQIAKQRLNGTAMISMSVLVVAFLGIGYRLYYENNVKNTLTSAKES